MTDGPSDSPSLADIPPVEYPEVLTALQRSAGATVAELMTQNALLSAQVTALRKALAEAASTPG